MNMDNPQQFWQQRYSDESYVYGTAPNEFLKQSVTYLDSHKPILSVAEGEGRNAVFLASLGFHVTAWDFALAAIQKCERLAKSQHVNVHTSQIDLHDVDWSQQDWHQIIQIFGHFPPELKRKTLAGISQSLSPGGVWILEVYSVHQLQYATGGPKDYSQLYQPEEILAFVENWHIPHFFMGEVERREGKLHNGLSHVIQMIARKPEMKI